MVQNMHLTATNEALLVSTVFATFSSVRTAHGSSRSEEDFRPSHHLLDICRYDIISAQITSSTGTSMLCFCSRRWRLLIAFDSSLWLPAELSSTAMEVDELSASDSTWSLTAVKSLSIFSPWPIVNRFLADGSRSVTNMTESFNGSRYPDYFGQPASALPFLHNHAD